MADIAKEHQTSGTNKECRACLVKINKKSGCVDLFRPWTPPWPGMGTSKAEDLARLACIQINESDTHSKIICNKCCIRLQDACSLMRMVQTSDMTLRLRLSECTNDAPSWPKPIQVEKNISIAFRREIQVEVKQEVVTEDEYDSTEYCEPRLDIKIEPEEITPALVEPEEITSVLNDAGKMQSSLIKSEQMTAALVDQMNLVHDGSPKLKTALLTPVQMKPTRRGRKKPSLVESGQMKPALARRGRKRHALDSGQNEPVHGTGQMKLISVEPRKLKPIEHGLKMLTTSVKAECQDVRMVIDAKEEPMSLNNSDIESDSDKEQHSENEQDIETKQDSETELPVECMLCMKKYNSVPDLKAHVIAAHSYKTITSLRAKRTPVCETCDKRFSTYTELVVHKSRHVLSEEFKCSVCEKTLDSFDELARHEMVCIRDEALSMSKEDTKDINKTIRPWPIYYILPNDGNEIEQGSPQTADSESSQAPASATQYNEDTEFQTDQLPESPEKSKLQDEQTFVSEDNENVDCQRDPNSESQDLEVSSEHSNLLSEPSVEQSGSDVRGESQLSLAKSSLVHEQLSELNSINESNKVTDFELNFESVSNDTICENIIMQNLIEESKPNSNLVKTNTIKSQIVHQDEIASVLAETNINTHELNVCIETSPVKEDTIKINNVKLDDIHNPIISLDVSEKTIECKHNAVTESSQSQEVTDKPQDSDTVEETERKKISENVFDRELETILGKTNTEINVSQKYRPENDTITIENGSHTISDGAAEVNNAITNHEPQIEIKTCRTKQEVSNLELSRESHDELSPRDMEIEKNGEDGMQIQLEIHSIEVAMDIDQELESEIKIQSSDSDRM